MAETQERLLVPILERWQRGDFSTWDENFAPDLLLTAFDPDGSYQARGSEEIGDNLRRFFRQFRDYRIEVGSLHRISDDVVLMEGYQLATGRLSDLEVRDTIYIVFRFASGRVSEMHWHPDREAALNAAGVGAD